ncbi:MAG: DUF1624 domain-containing protein [Syntrophomonadaceae bacterium]|nr:DUF1624 domain-containing protein [Syntrophomonadaceae bacterium]
MTDYPSRSRIWELDFLRGIALIAMIAFHTVYNLKEFYQVPVSYEVGPVYYLGRFAASLFIVVAGISCSLSKNNIRRGAKIFLFGLMITLVTYLVNPAFNIIFGILHFLGAAILLNSFFIRFSPGVLLILGTAIILAGSYFREIVMPNNLLAPFGLLGPEFFSVDYYPLVPWLGLFLYGVSLGKILYNGKKSLVANSALRQSFVNILGQHSLIIYLLHQPVILLLLSLLYGSFPF